MQKSFNVLVIIFIYSNLLLSQSGVEQNDSLKTYLLSDVVITATKTNTPVREIASSITILNEKDFLNSGKTFLADVLKEVPGISITQQGGNGKMTSVFIRGAKPHHTQVLVDGVKMNDPSSISNSFDFANLQTNNIERVEILRGPQSTLYGSDALAGVINIFTKRGSGKTNFSFLGEGGSYNTYKGSLGIKGGSELLNYSFNYSVIKNDGHSAANKKYGNSEKDAYNNNSFNSKIGLNPLNNFNLDFIFKYSKSKIGFDQNEILGDDPNFFANVDELSIKIYSSLDLFEGLWTQNFGAAFIKNINKSADGIDLVHPNLSSENYFIGNRMKLEWQNNLKLTSSNILTFGIETESEKAYSSYISTSEWGPYKSEFPYSKAITTGIYFQDQLKFFDSFYSTIGARYDKHNRFGSVLTYRIAPAYFVSSTDTKLKATYGTGFKSPSLYYLYEPTYGNTDLKPEKSIGWDAGIEQYLFNYKLSLGFTYFKNEFTDLIGFDKNFKTINIDKAETKGFEFFISSFPIQNLELSANYTFTDSKDMSIGSGESGKDLIRVPKNKLSLNINYSFAKANLNLEILNVGSREDKDFSSFIAERVKLKAYTLVNISVSYKMLNYLSLFGRVENLLNSDYEEVLYYGTAGLSAYIGFKLNF